MNFEGKHILVLEGYARQSLPLIKAFRGLGCRVSVLCGSRMDMAYVSRYPSRRILGVCDREDCEGTTRQVRELLKTGEYDMAVPCTDFSAELLSENKREFSEYAKIASNDREVYRIAADKQKTMEVCMENNIPCPITITNAGAVEEILGSKIKFPIVVKPRKGYGAIGFHRLDTREELERLVAANPDIIETCVVQEYIPQQGLQYECAVFMDDNNEAKTALVFSKNRWFPVEGGSSTLNITVDRPDIAESCVKLLKLINWRGAADIDLIEDPRDNSVKIMEINPRVSGSVKICFAAGVDQARQMLELAFGGEVTEYDRYKTGIRLRCSQTDLLWFIKSENRFKSDPSWFSLKNTYDQTFSPSDPLPWLWFSIHGVLSYRKEMSKRK